MIVELQIALPILLEQVRSGLRRQLRSMVGDAISFSGLSGWINDADALPSTSINRVPATTYVTCRDYDRVEQISAPNIEITQPISITLAGLDAQNNLTVLPPVTGNVVIALGVTAGAVGGENLGLILGYRRWETTIAVDPDVRSTIDTFVTNAIGGPNQANVQEFPLADLFFRKEDAGAPTIWNYGLAISEDDSFLAIRIEASAKPATATAWTAFYAGQMQPYLRRAGSNNYNGGNEARPWAQFADHYTIENAMKELIEAAIEGDDEVVLISGIGANWSGGTGDDRLEISATVKIPDSCFCVGVEDLNATFSIQLRFAVTDPDELRVNGDYSYEVLNKATEHCCSALMAVAWPALWNYFHTPLTKLNIDFLGYFVGSMQPIPVLMGGIEYRIEHQRIDSLPPECTAGGGQSFVCSKTPNHPLPLGLHLRSLAGLPEGLVLLGNQIVTADPANPDIEIDIAPFTWNSPPPSCAELSPQRAQERRDRNPLELVTAGGNIVLNNLAAARPGGSLPFTFKSAQILDDPFGVFRIGAVSPSASAVQIDIICPFPRLGYWQAPYPCKLLVTTTAGVQIASIPPVPNIDAKQAEELADRAYRVAMNRCFRIINPEGRIPFLWAVDPPPYYDKFDRWQLIEVYGDGLKPKASVHVVGQAGRPWATSVASPSSSVRLSLLMPAHAEAALQFESPPDADEAPRRTAGAAEGHAGDAHSPHLSVRRATLCELDRIAAGTAILDIAGTFRNGVPSVCALSENRLVIYQVGRGARAHPSAAISVSGAKGLKTVGSRLAVWGRTGLQLFALDADGIRLERTLLDIPVEAARCARGVWHVRCADRDIILDARLKARQEFRDAVRDGRQFAMTGRGGALLRLADGMTAARHGARNADAAPNAPEPRPIPPAVIVQHPYGDGVFQFSGHSGGILFATTAAGVPYEVARYEDDPWFVRAVSFPRELVTLDRHGSVRQFRIGHDEIF